MSHGLRGQRTLTSSISHVLPPCASLARSKSIEKRGPGVGYGFITAMCFTLAFFTLLCGLVLDGFKDVVSRQLAAQRELPWPVFLPANPS